MSTVDYYGYVPSPLPFSWLRGPPGTTVLMTRHIMMETKQPVVRLHNSVTLQLIDSFRGTATVYFYQTVLAIEKKLTTSTRTHFRGKPQQSQDAESYSYGTGQALYHLDSGYPVRPVLQSFNHRTEKLETGRIYHFVRFQV